jgi:hypothetical protein
MRIAIEIVLIAFAYFLGHAVGVSDEKANSQMEEV